MRITILGFAGSGKTSLAKNISHKLRIPHLQLDRLFLSNGGDTVKPDDEETKEKIRAVMKVEILDFLKQNSDWVSDGTYTRLQPLIADHADVVIFIKLPLWFRQWNHFKRVILGNNRHPEISVWQDLYFLFDMVRKTRESEERYEIFLEKYKDKLIILNSFSEINDYLDKLV